jgi:putative oxidoreductase
MRWFLMIAKLVKGKEDYFYGVFRILIGLLFMQHGAQKTFGMLSDRPSVELFSLFGAAGVIEFFGGLLIVIGVFTRLIALVAAVEMVIAYFMAHVPQGFFPILNGGELAALFFASFIVIMVMGARKWSLEKAILKKEIF